MRTRSMRLCHIPVLPIAALCLISFRCRSGHAAFVAPDNRSFRHDVSAIRQFLLSANNEENIDFTEFNPFQQRSSTGRRSPTSSTSNPNLVSLRQTQMQRITSELLDVVRNGNHAMREVLLQHKDFLLEPLEDENAVLELDSIYTPQMTRPERYQAYRVNMQERVARARDPQARSLLKAMMEFVLSYE